MGLDTTHNAFHGAYSAFRRFREAVCVSTGGSWDSENRCFLVGDDFSSETHPGLFEFFGHSDCDGEISPEMCGKIVDEMTGLLPAIKNLTGDFEGGHISRDGGLIAVTQRFIDGCREAAANNEPLKFR